MTEKRDTTIGTLRNIYGNDFAPEFQSEDKLSSLLTSTGTTSLEEYLVHSERGRRLVRSASDVTSTVVSVGSVVFARALKNLADK
jgi:hypothetical protein